MRRLSLTLIAVVGLWSLAACSPSVGAVVGLGYDAQGRLMGAVKVCSNNVARVDLAPATPQDAPTIGQWQRTSPLTRGAETWALEAPHGQPWRPTGRPLAKLLPDSEYLFSGVDREGTLT